MTVYTTQSPEYQIPNNIFNLTFSTVNSNFVRVKVTSAPPSSAYAASMVENQTTELEIGTVPVGSSWQGFQPDVAGVYTLKLMELQVGASDYGGYYYDDPAGWTTQSIEGTTTTNFYVGQRMEAEVGTNADTATLVMYVWDDTIRQTTVAEHGEASPALVDPATPKAETFVADSSVATALENMIGVAASTVAGNPTTILDDMLSEFEDHLSQSGVHSANDSDNIPSSDLQGATSPEQIKNSVGELIRLMRQHFDNDAGAGGGVGSAAYHSDADRTNAPISPAPADYLSSTFALADMWRAYETHRVSTTYHLVADATNSLTALTTGSLAALYKAISDVLASPNPTAPATDNEGATVLAHRGGLERS